jgi:hypothetical protein
MFTGGVPSSAVQGQSYDLRWTTTDTGPVRIVFETGPSNNLYIAETISEYLIIIKIGQVLIQTIVTFGSGGLYVWTVPTTLISGIYALLISDSTEVNYSG